MEESLMSLSDMIAIIRRRKKSLILPASGVMLLAAVITRVLPPTYKSTATILIEEQEIPSEFVTASITGYAEQRIQTINQRIMSYSRLREIINRYDLYHVLRDGRSADVVVDKMRRDTRLEMINANGVDPRTGRPSAVSIAFALSYEGKDEPRKIQKVASILTSLFLEENKRVRVRQTRETAKFLQEEKKRVKQSLDALEARIAEFKEKHIHTLPELLQVNIQNLSNIERSVEVLREQLHAQKEREAYLQAQLASLAPRQDDKQRLDQLRVQLVQLRTRFTDQYPDVIKTKAEIAQLERQMAAARLHRYGSRIPPDNPAHVALASQLSSIQAEISSSKAQIEALKKRAQMVQRQIEETPHVEETYRVLITERNNTQAKYDDLMRKVMEARVSQGLEKEQKGERFTLLDPARLPEKPYKPNRLAIAAIGLVLGVGAGIGTATLRELVDTSIHTARHLATTTSFPVLAMIPAITTARDLSRRRAHKIWVTVAVVGIMAGGVALFHFRVMDLAVLWGKVMQYI
jgi:succinoglycan biosynthesis transport protein ExoP